MVSHFLWLSVLHTILANEHTTYITHKIALNINEMTYTIAHIVDGFGHSVNLFGCNMNEYRHMTYRIYFCPWNNFTNGTP